MAVFSTAIINSPSDVERRLADFELTIDQILAIRDSARAAADDASPLMPLNAPGTLAYIYGVEALRAQILDKNWVLDRTLGVEAVVNRELGIRIGYQNVDKACDAVFKPMPRSAKGPASEKMCGFPLFEFYGMALETDRDRMPKDDVRDPLEDQVTTYFVMVGEDGSVELSSPIIEKQRYMDFRERVFVDSPAEDWETRVEAEGEPIDDFDVPVTLKDDV
ncbi:hypothetical protein [Roseibium aggregatum]|uniref:hypothetical protein n=1 Tax=Roseibium aggregatum TaxID=187304 RepID=UPI00094AA166|nr:hypothetical protein [Roseibium aggregatum]UFI04664.1 hypothetical protein ST40_005920 [Roseibium aggregatum]